MGAFGEVVLIGVGGRWGILASMAVRGFQGAIFLSVRAERVEALFFFNQLILG
jgi:hypothetical protein